MLTKLDVQKIKQVVKEVAVTKDDLKNELRRYATKDDLKNELRRYATKDDLKNELKNFATKNDLIGLARSSELDELKHTFIDNLAKWKDELFNKIDSVLGQLKSAE